MATNLNFALGSPDLQVLDPNMCLNVSQQLQMRQDILAACSLWLYVGIVVGAIGGAVIMYMFFIPPKFFTE